MRRLWWMAVIGAAALAVLAALFYLRRDYVRMDIPPLPDSAQQIDARRAAFYQYYDLILGGDTAYKRCAGSLNIPQENLSLFEDLLRLIDGWAERYYMHAVRIKYDHPPRQKNLEAFRARKQNDARTAQQKIIAVIDRHGCDSAVARSLQMQAAYGMAPRMALKYAPEPDAAAHARYAESDAALLALERVAATYASCAATYGLDADAEALAAATTARLDEAAQRFAAALPHDRAAITLYPQLMTARREAVAHHARQQAVEKGCAAPDIAAAYAYTKTHLPSSNP